MEISEIETWRDVMKYIISQTQDRDTIAVVTAIGIASVMTYILFYTDTPEALAASLGDLPGAAVDAIPF